jgi:lipopolysaccharide export system protein LptC
MRIWDLSGKEAVFVSDNIIRIIEMQLAITSSQDKEETILRSPNARIYVEDNGATGDGFVYVEGNGFNAEGKDWEWRGVDRKIEIRKGAKVTFDDAIRRILK